MEELAKIRKDIYTIKLKEYESIILVGKGIYSVAEAASFVFIIKMVSYLPGKNNTV